MSEPQENHVQLTHIENQILKAGVMVLMAAAHRNHEALVIGTIGGYALVQELGQDGLQALAAKMEAHLTATRDDGTVKVYNISPLDPEAN